MGGWAELIVVVWTYGGGMALKSGEMVCGMGRR